MSGGLADLFARAVELDAEARRDFLDELRGRDPAQAGALESLLAAAEADSPLDRPRWVAATRTPDGLDDPEPPLPASIGPYRVLRELGRGGMGRVFLVEEATAEFRRTLALKVIDSPFADGDAVRRFREELRILAQLEHPGIARFVQGGRTPEGVWYLALEYVDGVDLLAWSDERRLDAEERARLFLAALEPIGHAHGLGVVHRDLKPRHLLVDRTGRPRLLDFGISKLVEPGALAHPAATRTGSNALTPAYASPEQFRGEPVTPASDVYSLGVILFELLAGSRPFAEATTHHELERSVLETDPERPSLVARRTDRPLAAGKPRRSRGTALERDLDEICLRALRKRPGERYADASSMADDLRRALAGEAIVARRGGRRYRAARFVALHRTRLAFASLFAVAAIAAVVAWDARRDATLGAAIRPAPRPVATPSFLLRTPPPSSEVESELARRPGDLATAALLVRALIREGRIAEAEVAIGRLRQLPGGADDPISDYVDGILATSRGETQRALASNTRGLEKASAARRGDLVAMLRLGRARALSDVGRKEESLAEIRVARREAEESGDDVATAVALNDLGVAALSQGDFAAGEKLLELALPVARRAGDDTRLAFLVFNLGTIEHLRGRPDLGETRVREAIGRFEGVGNRRRAAISRVALAEILWDRGESSASRTTAESALEELRELEDHHAIANALALRARLDLEAGNLRAVEAAIDPIEQSARASGTPARLRLAEHLRGRLAFARGRFDPALDAFDAAGALAVQYGSAEDIAHEALVAVRVELAAGRPDRAAARLDRVAPDDSPDAETNPKFAIALLRTRLDLARDATEAARRRIDALGDASRSPSLERRLEFLAVRGALLAAEGRIGEARSDFEAARAAASAGGRMLTELELRLEQAAVEIRRGDRARAREAAAAVRERSRSLGLDALVLGADRLLGS